MPHLTRRREQDSHRESWHVYFGDVRIGWIGERAGVPKSGDQWGWTCGFHPRDGHVSGTAGSFDQARADFERAWRDYLPRCTDAHCRAPLPARRRRLEIFDVGCGLQDADANCG